MKKSEKIKDSWLVAQYCNGHKSAMAVLVKRWHGKFCKQAYVYSKDFDIAKDIAQDAWVAIMNNIDSIKSPDKFGSWGLSIVTKKSIDWYRKNKRNFNNKEEVISEEREFTLEDIDTSENILIKEKLKRAIASLSDEQQMVLKLFYMESYSLIEISDILSISRGTVKSRLYYAREKLKTCLRQTSNT